MKADYTISVFYRKFNLKLPDICKELKLTSEELGFIDYSNTVSIWLNENPSLIKIKERKGKADLA